MDYMFKGTKGPWYYNGMHLGKHRINFDSGKDEKTELVAEFYAESTGNHPTNEEWRRATNNAHLIAAAPDLLQVAINSLDDMRNIVPESPARKYRIEQIESAIHKALNIQP